MKLFTILVLFLFSINAGAFGFSGSQPDPDHIPQNPYQKNYIRVSSCSLQLKDKKINLHEPVGHYSHVFQILSLIKSGKQLISQFNIENSKSPFLFQELNINTRMLKDIPTKVGAAFIFDGRIRTIYYDPQDDLGLVTVFLAHELRHAIDPDVISTFFQETKAYKALPHEEYIQLQKTNTFRIERRAFNKQDEVLSELLDLTDCYTSFLQEHRERNGLKLFLPTPDSYIKSSYGL